MLALVGGAEWTAPAAGLDAWLLEQSGSTSVTVLPTANRAHPDMAVATARRHFRALGGEVLEAAVLTRSDAEQPWWRELLGTAPFLYLAGGDPGHLAAVLAGTPAWAGIVDALAAGAVVAGSSAGAMVFCSAMLRPGAGATEPGLGLLDRTLVLPHFERWVPRMGEVAAVLAGEAGGAEGGEAAGPAAAGMGSGGTGSGGTGAAGSQVLGIDECTALVLSSPQVAGGGSCRVLGAGSVSC
ncbi:MAG TPA: Type 1 glutamine amidotransferase-like domain-containing protein, partial [Actinomycetota bacterium]|nr:Type 1 glutamine amidotransferase-like domain-containing protein [Actinomycetota bacterium]